MESGAGAGSVVTVLVPGDRGDAPGLAGAVLVTSSVTVAAIRPAAAAAASQRPEGKRESLFGPWLISSNRYTWPGVHTAQPAG